MTDAVSVYAVFADDAEARRIGRDMVEARLAACVNILGPCHSIYRWRGEVEVADEVAAIFKTTATTAPELVRRIAQDHSYELPAAAIWPIVDLPENYRLWIAENVKR